MVATSFEIGIACNLKNVLQTSSKDVSKGETQYKIYLRNYCRILIGGSNEF
jgi:hypothetical protein